MSSDIKPGEIYAVIDIKVAVHSQNPEKIADGLNEFLSPEIGEGWVADYAIYQTDEPSLVKASNEPVEGELFTPASKDLYPDMDKETGEMALEHYEIDSFAELDQGEIDKADTMVAEVASNLAHNSQVASAISLLKNNHPDVAALLKGLCDTSLIRDRIQEHSC
jgi:hypothetical protein